MSAILGSLPAIVSAGVVTQAVKGLLERAGVEFTSPVETFANRAEYLEILSRAQERSVILQHVHDASEIDPAACWIDPGLLSFLNNKANLGELVPAEAVPERVLVAPRELGRFETDLPFYVKATTDESTGGCLDVCRCETRADLDRAIALVSGCALAVVEREIDMERNLCVNYAIFPDGNVEYVGVAEQIVEAGRQTGNWIGVEGLPSEVIELGRRIMEKGSRLGYRGFAAFDMAITREGRPVVFDLNFRINASTAPLLLMPAVEASRGEPLALSSMVASSRGLEAIIEAVKPAIDDGSFVPMFAMDPVAAGHPPDTPARLAYLYVGPDRDAILEANRKLVARLEGRAA